MGREAGWCNHMKVLGFWRPGGSTAFRIEHSGPVYAWWINEEVMVLMCEACYRVENPIRDPRDVRQAAGTV